MKAPIKIIATKMYIIPWLLYTVYNVYYMSTVAIQIIQNYCQFKCYKSILQQLMKGHIAVSNEITGKQASA